MPTYIQNPPPRFTGQDLAAIWQNLYCSEVMALGMSSSAVARHVITPDGQYHGDDAIHYRAATMADAYIARIKAWVAERAPAGDPPGDGQEPCR